MSRFGRKIQFDERSRNYPVRKIVEALPPITKIWNFDKVPLDQGNEGSCVGHGIAHELIAEPVPCLEVDHDYARNQIYLPAQLIDEFPDTPPAEGTSVLAGLKIINQLGWCDEYRWSFTHLDTQLGIGYEGPGICGSDWYSGMDETDSNGFIHVTGSIEGGHCYLFLGVNLEEEYFTILNSWGTWGIDGTGRAKLSFTDYEKLRTNQGEMAFLIGRHDIGIQPVPPEPPPPTPPDPTPSDCTFSNGVANTLNLAWELMGRKTRFITRKEVK
jgi:hypothetical protein